MARVKVTVGDKYNYWTVLERRGTKCKQSNWLCRCDCGTEREVRGPLLTSGSSKSCGCYNRKQKSIMTSKYVKENNGNYRHGEANKTKLHGIWASVKRRCYNEKSYHYKDYGGRGIVVCDEWQDYIPFRDWANANGYKDGLTIDRIDTNGDYEPDNCRWVDWDTQQNNRRNNVKVIYKDKEYSINDIAEITGLSRWTIRARIDKGWTPKKIFDNRKYNGHGEVIK